MEVIDYLFIFWIALVSVVYAIGTTYEKQLRAFFKITSQGKRSSQNFASKNDHSLNSTNLDHYSSQHNTSQPYNSQQSYNSNQLLGSYQNDLYAKTSTGYGEFQRQQLGSVSNEIQVEASYGTSNMQNYGNLSMDITGPDSSFRASENTIPTATGFNADCVDWVNSILYLFFTQPDKYGSVITESIYRSLNEKLSGVMSSSIDYGNIIVEFTGINRQSSTQPELKNIRTESESEKSVSAVCKIYNRRIVLDLTIRRSRSSVLGQSYGEMGGNFENETANYELVLENLEGKLKSVAILSDRLIVVQFMEKPDTKILLKSKGHSRYGGDLINEDTLVSIILQSLTQVVVDLYFGDDPDFPQFKQPSISGYRNKLNILKGSASEIKRQIKHDLFGALSSSSDGKERKIFIKVLRAKNINYNQNVTCLIELDNPYQQALSSTKQGSNPSWDEHFLFNISEKSNELSLELWDSINQPSDVNSLKRGHKNEQYNSRKSTKVEITSGGKFLGMAKISIGDLRKNPVQNLSLLLHSKNNAQETHFVGTGQLAMTTELSNSVGGELQVELLFIEHSNSSELSKSASGSSIPFQEGDVVSVERKLTPSGYVITTTTITKPNSQKSTKHNTASRHEQLSVRNRSPISSITDQSELEANIDGISSQVSDRQSNLDQQEAQKRRSRSVSRSRSFIKAIKKRFSFSRARARSVGESGSGIRGETHSSLGHNVDASSIDSRSRTSSIGSMGRAKSVPTSRDPSEVPTIVINKSRLSDTASAFTFTHPKSQLVIECTEPLLSDGIERQKSLTRYYAISDDAANKSKWRRRGIKLHLFNDHQFVACHLAGSSTCHLCGKVFSRRPGKQGYKCRNCHLLSHKQCHVKVDHNCPYALREGLKLEYIDADPPANLLNESLSQNLRHVELE